MALKVLAIVSHPDDAEFLCAGTLALLQKNGWEVFMATMTAGDCGSNSIGKKEISEIRKKEAINAANIIESKYECLGFEDLFIMYDKPSLGIVIAQIRKIQPHMVLTMSPSCYMVDHETTSQLVRSACFGAGIKNIETPGFSALDYIPHLYYADPIEGKDKFGLPVKATTVVDISNVINIKTKMLSCHESQREWLKAHHGMDEYILSMQRQSEMLGQSIGVKYAEGFRQHLGHAYPQNNLMHETLGDIVTKR